MKALVTGCAGFIGSNLTDYLLENGFEVYGLDCFTDNYSYLIKESNLQSALKNSDFKFTEKDIMDVEEFPEVDYVFHLAAQAGVRDSWGENFPVYTRNNIEATQKLLEFYKDLKIKKFVYSSSSSVYGDVDLPMKEGILPKPVSPYGVSKLAAEHLVYLYWKNYGLPTISLRYFTVYGPRQRPDMSIHRFVKSILKGEEITVYGDGEQTRDFTYVTDVVKAIAIAAESETNGEVFNVGGGSRISINNLLVEIEKVSGKKARINYFQKQKGDVKDTWADLAKIESVLSWKSETDVKTGIRNYIDWYINFYDIGGGR
ncbi:MAG: GDP-mannose 4,6-dehydratase [Methanobacterium sp.]|jgi:UDP-glucose 4-epimerase|nr:GDP-mannose 4,6-dehydratase [Methanobacterium sp.]